MLHLGTGYDPVEGIPDPLTGEIVPPPGYDAGAGGEAEHEASHEPEALPPRVAVEIGRVVLLGPGNARLSMTPAAAEETAQRLFRAAAQARRHSRQTR
jgi:hypothetical protein